MTSRALFSAFSARSARTPNHHRYLNLKISQETKAQIPQRLMRVEVSQNHLSLLKMDQLTN